MAHAVVESCYAGDGAAWGFVESSTVDAVGYGRSIGWSGVVWSIVTQWVGGTEVS